MSNKTSQLSSNILVEHSFHMKNVLLGLNSLRSKNLLLDVTLIADGEHFKAHRVVLASCSEYFRAMFTDEMLERSLSEIKLNGINSVGLQALLEYAYTAKVCLNVCNVLDILGAAAHCQVSHVVDACSAYLQSQMDMENCIDVLTVAETYHLTTLISKATHYICSRLKAFIDTKDFLEKLTGFQLLHILRSDYYVNCSEPYMVYAICIWLQHDLESRQRFAVELFGEIFWREIPSHRGLKKIVEMFLRGFGLTEGVRQFWGKESTLKGSKYRNLAHTSKKGTSTIISDNFMFKNINNCPENNYTNLISSNDEITILDNGNEVSALSKMSSSDTESFKSDCNTSFETQDITITALNGYLDKVIERSLAEDSNFKSLQGLLNTRGLELALIKIGGFSLSGVTNEMTYYHESTGHWRHLTSVPHIDQCNFGSAVLDNKLYVIGGCFDHNLTEMMHPFGFCYKPQNNMWSNMAPMLRERCRFTLSTLEGKLYAVGGVSEATEVNLDVGGDQSTNSCEVYDPSTDTWTTIAALPSPRTQHAAATMGNKILVTGGLDGEQLLDSSFMYDPLADVWSRVASLLTPRADHACLYWCGRVLVVGGWTESPVGVRTPVSAIEEFEPELNRWTIIGHLPSPKFHAGICIAEDKLWVVGGGDAPFDRGTGAVEVLDLRKRHLGWIQSAPCPSPVWEHALVALYVPRVREEGTNFSIVL